MILRFKLNLGRREEMKRERMDLNQEERRGERIERAREGERENFL